MHLALLLLLFQLFLFTCYSYGSGKNIQWKCIEHSICIKTRGKNQLQQNIRFSNFILVVDVHFMAKRMNEKDINNRTKNGNGLKVVVM